MSQERKPGQPGTLYLIPCPIAEDTARVGRAAGGEPGRDRLAGLFHRGECPLGAAFSVEGGLRPSDRQPGVPGAERAYDRCPGCGRELVRPILAGRSAGVISEAGVPGVADPGALVGRPGVTGSESAWCRLIGPSSIILAVMASGLNGQSFAFNGYLPVKPPERARAIRTLRTACDRREAVAGFYRGSLPECEAARAVAARYCAPDTRLTLAVDITSPQEYIRTLTVREWRSAPAAGNG